MAVRSVATTDTLDTFRTTFNSLASTDIGDVATMTTSASSIVGAVNELNSSVAGDLVVQTFGHRYNADGSNTYTQFTVTVATKTSTHIYNGTGSSNGYLLNNSVAPFIDFKVGNTYRFDQADATNDTHPLRFYYDAARTTIYSTGVTTNGTPGNAGAYTQIVVSETTPNILYYMCSSHAHMGNRIDVHSSTNVIDSSTAFVDSTGTAINFASTNFAIAQAVALG
tara:strand:- start:34 stop:705 length:672 start_codon:yes stop_codon:yes gene_type:complete